MLLDKLTQIVPKALLPITVLILGFIIIAASMILTKLVVKVLDKIKNKNKKRLP